MIKMEYHIISGRTIETRRCWMPARSSAISKAKRTKRIAGNTSLKKIAANEREAVRRLARIINCNFGRGDLWICLKYSDDRLPESYEAAKAVLTKFLRKVRAEYKKRTGKPFRYIATTSNVNPRNGKEARLHHHVVMDRVAYEIIAKYWPEGEISYSVMGNRGDHTAMAKYMVENSPKEAGKKKWSTSRGLKKPIYTEPEQIADIDKIEAPSGAEVKENVFIQSEETGIETAYMRCVMPDAPKPRGKKIKIELSDPSKARARAETIKGGGKNGV